MTKDETLRMALEALEVIYDRAVFDYSLPADHFAAEGAQEAITAIKEALAQEQCKYPDCKCPIENPCLKGLAQPEQEPVAWMYPDDLERFQTSETFAQAYSIEVVSPTHGETVPLYTTPPQRKPLTDEEIDAVTDLQWAKGVNKPIYAAHRAYARAIEAKLKEKNGYAEEKT